MRKRKSIGRFGIMAGLLAAMGLTSFAPPALADPLGVGSEHPLIALTGGPALEGASVANGVSLRTSYTSMYMEAYARDWSGLIDMETARLELIARKKIGPLTELSANIPVLSHNDGFLDAFLEEYHGALGVSNQGREDRARDDFAYALDHGSSSLIEGENGEAALGDIRLGIKRELYSASPVILGAYAYLDLPTGDPDRGYGNGRLDGGAALLAEWTLSGALTVAINAGLVVPGGYDGIEESVDLEPYPYAGWAMGWDYSGALTLKADLILSGSPWSTGISDIDGPAMVGAFGAEYGLSGGDAVTLALTEDLSGTGAPDFTLSLQWRRGSN